VANDSPILALPDKPSIAVLPFTNMSSDSEQEFFADGITEDIITALAQLRWLFVIARNSTFIYKGKPVDVRQAARDLGVRYILEGSVRAAGNRIRITGQLIDAETGKHIWAERYDRQLEDIFAVQDEITRNVVAAIEPHLYSEEGLRSAGQTPESIATWSLVIRALTLINKVNRTANKEAQALLRIAIAREQTYARAHAILAWALWWEGFDLWRADRAAAYKKAAEFAERALGLDPDEPWARLTLGLTFSNTGDHERALEEFKIALTVHPNWALGRTMHGVALVRAGYFDEAVAETAEALRMSPLDAFSGIYTAFHGMALHASRRFAEAATTLRRSVSGFPGFSSQYNTLISTCGHLGLVEEAQALLRPRNQLVGTPLHVGAVRRNLSKFAHGELFADGLAKAGVPD
jgi:adenylate cyclase